ncbi:hypothetical protein BGX34_003162 [Mortierella sp. NVP85]|nr:hypothetical protein BGX34_003162 [Mortierella sp. NVP85]
MANMNQDKVLLELADQAHDPEIFAHPLSHGLKKAALSSRVRIIALNHEFAELPATEIRKVLRQQRPPVLFLYIILSLYHQNNQHPTIGSFSCHRKPGVLKMGGANTDIGELEGSIALAMARLAYSISDKQPKASEYLAFMEAVCPEHSGKPVSRDWNTITLKPGDAKTCRSFDQHGYTNSRCPMIIVFWHIYRRSFVQGNYGECSSQLRDRGCWRCLKRKCTKTGLQAPWSRVKAGYWNSQRPG